MYLDITMNSFTHLLERDLISKSIKEHVLNFDKLHENLELKKGLYVYGSPGAGKSYFVEQCLREIDFDIIKYDAGDVRNKNLIESLTSDHLSNVNVLDMLKRKKRKIAIIMDEIDGMNSGDKGGISSLITLIRQKKTKKQKTEHRTNIPIICIGNYFMDKKIKELMKVCTVYELKTPTTPQIEKCLLRLLPCFQDLPNDMKEIAFHYIQGDLRKMFFFKNLYQKNQNILTKDMFSKIFQNKNYNDDVKEITHDLFTNQYSFEDHSLVMNETERTIVALLWHENVINYFKNNTKYLDIYYRILNNICYADYIDRVTFQHQIWQFNEMSSLMKTFHSNKLFHQTISKSNKPKSSKHDEIRFTKVLTKYSSEYNNNNFIISLCQKLNMDKRDVICLFQELRLVYQNMNSIENVNKVTKILEECDICRLDVKRIYRYLDKNTAIDEA